MSTSAQQLMNAAQEICGLCKDEAMARASLSRLYYASFHRCREFHNALPLPGSVGTADGTHAQLIAQLGTPAKKLEQATRETSIALSKLLRGLYSKRVKADYHVQNEVSQDEVKEAITSSRILFEALEEKAQDAKKA
jgi:uncharacterized protein (UPF0332 family)